MYTNTTYEYLVEEEGVDSKDILPVNIPEK